MRRGRRSCPQHGERRGLVPLYCGGGGHAGQGGTSFAMADPERNLTVAVLFNAGLDYDTALTFRRVTLVDTIYRALDDLG